MGRGGKGRGVWLGVFYPSSWCGLVLVMGGVWIGLGWVLLEPGTGGAREWNDGVFCLVVGVFVYRSTTKTLLAAYPQVGAMRKGRLDLGL